MFHVNGIGQNVWEEIDLGASGADLRLAGARGHCAQTGSATSCGGSAARGMTNPIHDYDRSTGCGSITGGAFVPDGIWPTAYEDGYLFSDYNCGRLMMLKGGTRTGYDGPRRCSAPGVRAVVGQPGALPVRHYANGGEIRAGSYTNNRTPTAC